MLTEFCYNNYGKGIGCWNPGLLPLTGQTRPNTDRALVSKAGGKSRAVSERLPVRTKSGLETGRLGFY